MGHFCSLNDGHATGHRCWCETDRATYSLPPVECEARIVHAELAGQRLAFRDYLRSGVS